MCILFFQVLSKPHAIISYESGHIFRSDCGSSNGTFINNFRIGSTNKKSSKQEIFSQDILRLVTCYRKYFDKRNIRFGSSIVDKGSNGIVEKCIIGKLKIFDENGDEWDTRPISNR